MPKKIIILTTGQPSTNPRMVKEYISLTNAGYQVKVFYSFWHTWAGQADKTIFDSGELNKKDFVLIGGSPDGQNIYYVYTKILQKLNQYIYRLTKRNKEGAFTRTTTALINAALNEQADLYIAHNAGALPAAVKGAKRYKSKAVFDAEDYHRGEYKNQQSEACELLMQIENKYLPQCCHITTASPLISDAYKNLYPELRFSTINNVFSKKYLKQFKPVNKNEISFFWFSQTIGPERGLETVVKALNASACRDIISLHLMGNIAEGFDKILTTLADKVDIHFYNTVPPAQVFEIASKFDIGLSIEVANLSNRNVCLTNKIFTYLLAGNCILFSDTSAQEQFYNQYPQIGFVFEQENEAELISLIDKLCHHPNLIEEAKKASLNVASESLNWEYESKKYLQIIAEII